MNLYRIGVNCIMKIMELYSILFIRGVMLLKLLRSLTGNWESCITSTILIFGYLTWMLFFFIITGLVIVVKHATWQYMLCVLVEFLLRPTILFIHPIINIIIVGRCCVTQRELFFNSDLMSLKRHVIPYGMTEGKRGRCIAIVSVCRRIKTPELRETGNYLLCLRIDLWKMWHLNILEVMIRQYRYKCLESNIST